MVQSRLQAHEHFSLHRTVADKLKAGLEVRPEYFDECTVYFSDIVSFTTLAAASNPMQIVDLLNFEEGTAGSIMGKELVKVYEEITVSESVVELLRQAEEITNIYTIYVVDEKERLKGRLSLKKLLVAQPTSEIQTSLENTNTIYEFTNAEGQSSVSYTGQNLRQVLINDTKLIFNSMKRGEFEGNQRQAFNTLNSIYEYRVDGIKVSDKAINGSTPLLVTAKDTLGNTAPLFEFLYLDILEGSKDLKSKMAGIDNPLRNGKLLGWETLTLAGQNFDADGDGTLTPDELMKAYMNVVAVNASSSEKTFTVPARSSWPGRRCRTQPICIWTMYPCSTFTAVSPRPCRYPVTRSACHHWMSATSPSPAACPISAARETTTRSTPSRRWFRTYAESPEAAWLQPMACT